MTVSVVIPFRPALGRYALASWVLQRIRGLFPEWEVLFSGDGCWDPKQPFVKSRAINRGVERAAGEIVVIYDADLIIEPDRLRMAAIIAETDPWVVPFDVCDRLTMESTEAVLKQPPHGPLRAESLIGYTRQTAAYGGGILVLRKVNFYAAGGFDERFVGWGGEDSSFGFALNELVGHYMQLPGLIYHLWHPEADRGSYHDLDGHNRALRERYRKAGVPDEMRALVAEHNREVLSTR